MWSITYQGQAPFGMPVGRTPYRSLSLPRLLLRRHLPRSEPRKQIDENTIPSRIAKGFADVMMTI
jgi:hypothetical protein